MLKASNIVEYKKDGIIRKLYIKPENIKYYEKKISEGLIPYQNSDMQKNGEIRYFRIKPENMQKYNEKIKEGLIPYQSIDMMNSGSVRYTDKDDYYTYKINRDEYMEIMKNNFPNRNFELSSGVDIHKMRRNNEKGEIDVKYNYKYLIQIDKDHIIPHLETVCKVIDKGIISDKQFTFVPYIEESKINEINASKHNYYTNINIVNNSEYMKYLKSKIVNKEQLGKLLYKLNSIFYFYNNFSDILSSYDIKSASGDKKTDSVPMIDKIIDIEWKRLSGLDKHTIATRLYNRNEKMSMYNDVSVNNCDINKLYKEYYDSLVNRNSIEEDIYKIQHMRRCNASEIMFDGLINDEFKNKPLTSADDDIYYNKCRQDMKFAQIETFKTLLHMPYCDKCVNQIKNNDIKKKLLSHKTSELKSSRCIYIKSDYDKEAPEINVYEEYMPDWYSKMCESVKNNKSIEDAYNHRQLILSDSTTTNYLKQCSLIFRADPFISRECDLPGLVHDTDLNKVIIGCLAGSDDIFPIRIAKAHKISKLNLYEYFEKNVGDIFLGSLIIKVNGDRTNYLDRYYILYMYYNPNRRDVIRIVNFRGNIIISGTLFEHVRLLYLELNMLMYHSDVYKNDQLNNNIKLHFYKKYYDDKMEEFDVFVSKYDIDTIRTKYQNDEYLKNIPIEYLSDNNLKEVFLTKDDNKKFIFNDKVLRNLIGGSKTIDKNLFYTCEFKCNNYKWNIQTSKESLLFDKEVFSNTLFIKQSKIIAEYSKITGQDVYKQLCLPINYLRGLTIHDVGKIKSVDLLLSKKDNNITTPVEKFNLLKPNESILAYIFEASISILFYSFFTNYLNPNVSVSYLIFSKNHYALDGIIYYNKYKLFKYKPENFIFYSYEVENKLQDKIVQYLTKEKIKNISITTPMDNVWVNDTIKNVKNVDMAIVDIIINISDIHEVRYLYLLQSQIPAIIVSLKKLNKNGTMILNTGLIPNKMVYTFISYLSCWFDKTYVMEIKDFELHESYNLLNSWVVFEHYHADINDIELNKLFKINELYYKLDPSGGYMFNIFDTELKKEFDINYNPEKYANQYITNIIDIIDPSIDKQYDEYKEFVKSKFLGSIRNFTQKLDLYTNRNDTKYIEEKCKISKVQAIQYARKYDLPLVDWVNKIPEKYLNDIIINKIKNIDFTTIDELNPQYGLKLKSSTNSQEINLFDNLAVSESAYQYIEKINYENYKDIELFINSQQKLLNKLLKDKYKITINGQYVSRAWIKFFELLSDTKLLNKYNDKLKVLHMCEAPGNFINSMDHFIKTKTKIKSYDWNAQSLSADLADFYDTYKFIEKTRDKWDMGPKKTGDILDPENQKYYINKYKDCDLMISDCGEKWTGEEIPDNQNLSIYQLYYALLIPCVGGNFVIKSFTVNDNKLYLSLLAIICEKYERVKVFKSNTNFWSPEIYIVGMNKKKLTDSEHDVLLKCLDNLNKGKPEIYPLESIPDNFIKQYNKLMYSYISYTADIKKFFVFLSLNQDLLKKNKDKITKILYDKNVKWIKKYIN